MPMKAYKMAQTSAKTLQQIEPAEWNKIISVQSESTRTLEHPIPNEKGTDPLVKVTRT